MDLKRTGKVLRNRRSLPTSFYVFLFIARSTYIPVKNIRKQVYFLVYVHMFVCEHLETQGLSTTMSVSGWSPFFRVRVRGRDMNVATQVFTNTQIQTRAFTVSVCSGKQRVFECTLQTTWNSNFITQDVFITHCCPSHVPRLGVSLKRTCLKQQPRVRSEKKAPYDHRCS